MSASPLSSLSEPEVAFLLKESQLLRNAVKAKNSERVADLLADTVLVDRARTAWLADKSELVRTLLDMSRGKGGPDGVLIIGPEAKASLDDDVYTFLKHYGDNEAFGDVTYEAGGYHMRLYKDIDLKTLFSLLSWRGVHEPRPITVAHVKDLIGMGLLIENTLPHGATYKRDRQVKKKPLYSLKGVFKYTRRAPRLALSPPDKRLKSVKPSHRRSSAKHSAKHSAKRSVKHST